jgi:hypothetical protein
LRRRQSPVPAARLNPIKIGPPVESRLRSRPFFEDDSRMSANYQTGGPVTLSEEQVVALHQKLRTMRHDVNGRLANIVAAAELMRMRPDSAAQRLPMLLEQPHKAAETIAEFSRDFEAAFGLKRG